MVFGSRRLREPHGGQYRRFQANEFAASCLLAALCGAADVLPFVCNAKKKIMHFVNNSLRHPNNAVCVFLCIIIFLLHRDTTCNFLLL